MHEIDDSVADSTGYRLRLSLNSVKENRVEFYFSQYTPDESGNFDDKWEMGANYIVTFFKNAVNPLLEDATFLILLVNEGMIEP